MAGVTARDVRFAAVTVSTHGAEITPFKVAVIELVPVVSADAISREPLPLATEATAVIAEVQVTMSVTSCVDLSE